MIRSLIKLKKPTPSNSARVRPIAVLLAEDHAGFRKSLRGLVELDGDIKVVGEAKNGNQAVGLTDKLDPDVVVMDIAMPLLNGLQATHQIMETGSATRILILSSHADPEYIRQAMLCGGSGYLVKQSSAPFIAEGIREVMKGNAYFSASIPKPLRDECQKVFAKGKSRKK